MTAWWKIGIVAAYTLLVAGLAWHVKGTFDTAERAKALQEQIDAERLEQGRIADQAAATEAALAEARKKYATLNQQWSAARAKSHPVCQLSADAVGLLKAATSPAPGIPR